MKLFGYIFRFTLLKENWAIAKRIWGRFLDISYICILTIFFSFISPWKWRWPIIYTNLHPRYSMILAKCFKEVYKCRYCIFTISDYLPLQKNMALLLYKSKLLQFKNALWQKNWSSDFGEKFQILYLLFATISPSKMCGPPFEYNKINFTQQYYVLCLAQTDRRRITDN